ncbi:MAG: glycosyltransferase family 2 protein [Succinivibrio sp.]|nr:glycosyltransferase family 2 protein [Succinivibrio sp.]
MLISVIVTTYNRPDALSLILKSFNYQTDRNFEVIVADDGSGKETRKIINRMIIDSNYPITYVWQEDEGFRLSQIRNRASLKAKGDYLIFLDGDCIPRPSFIEIHRKLAQKGFLVAGNRISLSEQFTQTVLDKEEKIWNYSLLEWIKVFSQKGIDRLHPLFVFPYFDSLRNLKDNWKKVRGCNFALFKEDYFKVNGCDCSYEGWGYEDSDLAIRLIRSGLKIKSGRYATGVFHLYHRENDRTSETENLNKLNDVLNSDRIKAENGIDQLKL